MKERKRIAEATAGRYRKAGKKENGIILNEFVELTGLRVAMRPWCCGIKDGGYCQLKLNIADFTTSCWGLLPSACHKWWPFSRIFT